MNATDQVKLGPILLAPGIKRSHVIYFTIAYCISLSLNNFIGVAQPFVLTEVLHLSRSEQGAITGSLLATQQAAILMFLLVFGALADRIGRKLFVIAALSIMTFVLLVFPLAASIVLLFLLRFLFGTGVAAFNAGGGAIRIDLPDNSARGKMSILMSLVNVVAGAVFVSFLGARLPAWLMDQGFSAEAAARYTFWLLAALGLAAILASLGLQRDRPAESERHSAAHHLRHLADNLREVITYARDHRRYRMLLLLAPITRSDTLIMGTFLSLWVLAAGNDQGLSSAEAMRTMSNVAMVVSAMDIIASFIGGLLADRFDRLRLSIASIVLTAAAFSTPLWVNSVTGLAILVAVAVIQLAEGMTTVSISALTGELTPPHMRASTHSVYVWIGMVSGMFIGLLGGWLFDRFGYAAPFLLISGLAITWLSIATAVLWRAHRLRHPVA